MCGIAGIVDWDSPQEDLVRKVSSMSYRIRHRGPDGSGMWSDSGISLAHRRLALLDIENGHQPHRSSDGRYLITYNGEVYNFRELRAELKDYAFRTDCDTEVVLAAYIQWGTACLPKLNGMFSFFIWDRKRQEGFAARDRLGVKPFVYRRDDGTFQFASEAKALVNDSPKVDPEAILEYLVAPCFSGVERSPFKDIRILQPGHAIKVSRAAIRTEKWIDVFDQPTSSEHQPDLRKTVSAAIERSLISDRPVATYLSGGFDSTLITAIAKPKETFSIQFENQNAFDEARSRIVISDDEPYARLAAELLGIPLTVVKVQDTSLRERMKRIAQNNDLLPAWEQEVAQDALAELASRSFRAIMVGDAADETHYGYHFLLDEECCQRPANLFTRFSKVSIQKKLLKDPVQYFDAKYKRLIKESGHSDMHSATTYLIVKRWLPRLLHNGDIHAMAYGLEARVPFADTELIAIAQSISPKTGMDKSCLRDSVKGLMPEAIRTRQKSALPKSPMGWLEYQRTLREELNSFGDYFNGFLEMDSIIKLVGLDSPSEQDQSLMFRLCCLGYWFKHYNVTL